MILRGLPVRPAFWKPAATTDKSTLRKQLGLATDARRKTVLLMGGGDGVGGIENIACEVKEALKHRSGFLITKTHTYRNKNIYRLLIMP